MPVSESPGAPAVLRAIHERRSRARLGGDVSDEQIRTLIAAAVTAPNHRRTRPWRFTVLRGDARARLGKLWGALMEAESDLDGSAAAEYGSREARKPLRAPVIIVVSASASEDPVRAEEDVAATAAATQNLLLAAEALALGAIWRTGAMVARPEVKAHLDLDASDRIVAFVYLGQPDGETPQAPPHDVDGCVRWRS